MPFLRNGVAEDADPYLVDALSALGDTYGPLAVALVAAGLTDANVLIDELHDEVADADAEEREPVHTTVVEGKTFDVWLTPEGVNVIPLGTNDRESVRRQWFRPFLGPLPWGLR